MISSRLFSTSARVFAALPSNAKVQASLPGCSYQKLIRSIIQSANPLAESYQQFYLAMNSDRTKTLENTLEVLDDSEIQSIVCNSQRLSEIVTSKPYDTRGSAILYNKLGALHLNEIITSPADLIKVHQTILLLLTKATLEKAFDTAEKLVSGIIWASTTNYDIHMYNHLNFMNPSFLLNDMLNKLGKEYVTNLISNPLSLVTLLTHDNFTEDSTSRNTLIEYIDLQPKPELANQNISEQTFTRAARM